jgi:hypothetical protein
MLPAGKSPVRIPDEVNVFNLPNTSRRTRALGFDSASNRNEYQEFFLGIKSGRRLGLTTLPPSMSRMSENVGASTSRNPKGLHCLYEDHFTFTLTFIHDNVVIPLDLQNVSKFKLNLTVSCLVQNVFYRVHNIIYALFYSEQNLAEKIIYKKNSK